MCWPVIKLARSKLAPGVLTEIAGSRNPGASLLPAKALLIAAALLAISATHAAERYLPGQSYFGRNKYIEYIAGDLPVILSAPHGGRERPEELPDRESGTFAFDTNTQELAHAVADEL